MVSEQEGYEFRCSEDRRTPSYTLPLRAEEQEIKLPASAGSSKKKTREFQKKTSISALLTMPKSLNVWITVNCGKL